jgi:hypothetical protein
MAPKTTPEKPPTKAMGSKAARPLAAGKASAKIIQSMAGRIESERSANKRKVGK